MPLTKRYSLKPSVVTHIFDGELNSKGSFAGFHSEQRKNLINKKLIITQIDGINAGLRLANKPYRANVKIDIGGKIYGPEWKSIFPKNWSEADTIRWIEQSLTKVGTPQDNVSKRSSHKEWKDRPRDFRIGRAVQDSKILTYITVNKVGCLLMTKDGDVESVFPNRDGDDLTSTPAPTFIE